MKRLALALLACTGCSFVFVHGPPSELSSTEPPDCTQFPIAPLIDGLVTAGGVALTVEGVRFDQPHPDQPVTTFAGGGSLMIMGGVLVGLFALTSTIYGTIQVTRCIRAHRAFTAHLAHPQ